VELALTRCDDIVQVAANPATGSVLIVYRPERVGRDEVLRRLRQMKCLRMSQRQSRAAITRHRQSLRQQVTENVIANLLEFAVRGLVSALA
jgi:hypothetical protein